MTRKPPHHPGPEEYNRYMNSRAWPQKKKEWREKSGRPYICEVCGADEGKTVIHLHHKTYIHFGDERLDELTPLCEEHHTVLHQLYDQHRIQSLDPQAIAGKPLPPKRKARRNKVIEPGSYVKITSGPFEGYEGPVSTMDQGKATVRINVYGRRVPAECELGDLKKCQPPEGQKKKRKADKPASGGKQTPTAFFGGSKVPAAKINGADIRKELDSKEVIELGLNEARARARRRLEIKRLIAQHR